MSTIKTALQKALQAASISLPDEQVDKLDSFLALIDKWNRVYNLTAVRQVSEMIPRHIIDSLALLEHLSLIKNDLQDANGVDVIDIGSGAGLPVIPLAIARPDLSFLSIESNGKKTRFQQQVKLELKLGNVDVVQERVENVNAEAQVVVSRAFTAPDKFLKIAEPLCVSGGFVLVMLGLAEKLPVDLPKPFVLESIHQLTIAGLDSERHIAIIKKQN